MSEQTEAAPPEAPKTDTAAATAPVADGNDHGHGIAAPVARVIPFDPTNRLVLAATDAPGAGGANHRYGIFLLNAEDRALVGEVLFQHGPIAEVGINGISNEALLAIVQDRLASFQSGPYACPENAAAQKHVDSALAELNARTSTRMARGVEGTHEV